MSIEGLYGNAAGRALLVAMQRTGMYRPASYYLKTRISRRHIPAYIEKHGIDMSGFEGQEYRSFAEFFARKRDAVRFEEDPDTLISPCDGLLSVYEITPEMNIPMKGSHYRLGDIVTDAETAEKFGSGLCLVFRLRPSDYHHICAFDDMRLIQTHFMPGALHSVQPISCDKYPVYRLNRRWWSVLDSAHFGRVVQIEVGAMLVGGVKFEKETGDFVRGEEFGAFELCGSTVILLLDKRARERLELYAPEAREREIPVTMGEGIGRLRQ